MSAVEGCRFEQQVLEAVRSGDWTSALRDHARGCDECAAAISIAPWMSRFSATDMRERPLPDPAIVWMKAQLLRGTATVDRAARPLQVAQFVAYFVVSAGWVALAAWKWNVIQGWIGAWTPTRIAQSAAAGGSLSAAFLVGVFLLGSVTIVLALHTILAEE